MRELLRERTKGGDAKIPSVLILKTTLHGAEESSPPGGVGRTLKDHIPPTLPTGELITAFSQAQANGTQ